MIIDGYRFAKYLKDTGISAEQFWLMYRIMILEQNIIQGVLKLPVKEDADSALEFSIMSEEYQRLHVPHDSLPSWVEQCFDLKERGFVEIRNRTPGVIKLSEIKVTEKFKGFFFISEVEKAFEEVMDMYPSYILVNGNQYLAKDKPRPQLQELYDKHILKGGGAGNHERFMIITKMYLERNKHVLYAPYKLSRFITDIFEPLAEAMEKNPDDDPFNEEL